MGVEVLIIDSGIHPCDECDNPTRLNIRAGYEGLLLCERCAKALAEALREVL
jgi:hypothetical protein